RNTSDPISGAAIQDLRIYRRVLAPAEVESLAKATRYASVLRSLREKKEADLATLEKGKEELFGWWLATLDGPSAAVGQELVQLEREQRDIQSRATVAHVMQEKTEPAAAFVLFRGEYDKRRDQVGADTPEALPPFPADLPRNRLGFAKWLLLPEQPLTARV